MDFWRVAGSLLHPTAESQECFEAVYEALKAHISAHENYPAIKAQWDERVAASKTKASQANWSRKKPIQPSSDSLKIRIKDLLSAFPYMSQYRHLFKNLLQVNTVPYNI